MDKVVLESRNMIWSIREDYIKFVLSFGTLSRLPKDKIGVHETWNLHHRVGLELQAHMENEVNE